MCIRSMEARRGREGAQGGKRERRGKRRGKVQPSIHHGDLDIIVTERTLCAVLAVESLYDTLSLGGRGGAIQPE